MRCPNCLVPCKTSNDFKTGVIFWYCACGFQTTANDQRCDELWAFVSVDSDGNEGVIGASIEGYRMPLVCADSSRVKYLRPIAINLAKGMGIKVNLIKFSKRSEIESFDYSRLEPEPRTEKD